MKLAQLFLNFFFFTDISNTKGDVNNNDAQIALKKVRAATRAEDVHRDTHKHTQPHIPYVCGAAAAAAKFKASLACLASTL